MRLRYHYYLTKREVASIVKSPHLLLTIVLSSTVTPFDAKRRIAMSEHFCTKLPLIEEEFDRARFIPSSVMALMILFLTVKS